jgi:hypothetical protein
MLPPSSLCGVPLEQLLLGGIRFQKINYTINESFEVHKAL